MTTHQVRETRFSQPPYMPAPLASGDEDEPRQPDAQRNTEVPAIDQVLAEMAVVTGVQRAFVAVAEPSSNAVRATYGVNVPSYLLESVNLPLDDSGPLVQSLVHGVLERSEDIAADRRIPKAMKEFYLALGASSMTIIPLLAGSAALVVSKEGPITDSELALLLPFVGRLSVAIRDSLGLAPARRPGADGAEERAWLWFMLNAVPDPVIVSDERNNIVLENIHAERLFKSSTDDPEGKRYAVELNSFLFSAALSSFSLDQSGTPGRELTLAEPVEGGELLYEMIVQPATNPETGERAFVTFLQNVTDLRRVVMELRQSFAALQISNSDVSRERDRLNLILENIETPIVVAGPASEIILMNSTAERLLQPPEGRHPRRWVAAYSANDAKLTSFLAEFQLETGVTRRGELQFVDPITGSEIDMAVTGTKARNAIGQAVAIVCVMHDLTRIKELERQRLERQLSESEKLAAVGRLAAAVAHEVNNPLESIKNALTLVVDKTPADAPTRRFLDIANSETQRVSSIIRQMLNFYRSEAPRKDVQIEAILRDVINVLQIQFGKDLVWRTHFDRELPPVHAAEDKLKQVFLNLFINAKEAMSGAGEISVVGRLANTTDVEFSPGKYVMVDIADTGQGIREEDLPQIFDPFFSTKRGGRGTGLGLWVSQDIVQQHGGQIRVRSRVGVGTTFTVAIPAGGNYA